MITIDLDDPPSKELVESFNKTLMFIERQCVDRIVLCTDAPATTKEHYLSGFDWVSHALLRRVINLAEQYANSVNQVEVLAAAILGRALIETIAHFHHLLNETEKYLKSGKFDYAYYLTASYMLGGRHGFDNEGGQLKKLHINDSLRDMDDMYEGRVQSSHDWLCEFVHPNSLGTTLSFSRIDKPSGCVLFFEKVPADRSRTPMLDAAIWMPAFQYDWERVQGLRELLLATWVPSVTVCDLFERK